MYNTIVAGRDDVDVTAAIERGEVAPVYCLHGEERFLLERCLAAIKTAVLGRGGGNAFNQENFDLKEGSTAAAVAAARTVPMFTKRRLVLARGIDQVKADDLEPLLNYAKDPNPTTCLVLVGEKVDGRLRAFQALKKAGFLHEFPRLRDREAAAWIARFAKERKITMADDAATALAQTVGPDLGRLAMALDQLALFAGPQATVTREHVETLVAGTRERDVFDLTRAIGLGERTRALRFCANLLAQREAPLKLQFMLARQLRQIWRAKELAAAGASRNDIAAAVKISPYFLDDVLVPAKRMSVAALERGFARLYEADRNLKSSRLDGELQLMRLVRQMADDAADKKSAARA